MLIIKVFFTSRIWSAARIPPLRAGAHYIAHHEIARKAAEQGAVLLKNEDGILPLERDRKITVIGAMVKNIRYQGAGSSHINPQKLSQPIDYLPNAVFAMGCDERGDTDEAMIKEAVKAAENAAAAVVFAGLPDRFESEGFNRNHMKLPQGHLRMLEEVSRANKNTIVVLLSGCVVECTWAFSPRDWKNDQRRINSRCKMQSLWTRAFIWLYEKTTRV